MEDQLPTLGDLASILQLSTGISLAMGVFRAPYENVFHSLGAILDREEVILAGRSDPLADEAAQKVLDARITWVGKGKELEPKIARLEMWIWASVVISGAALVASALYPSLAMSRGWAIALLIACLAPLLYGGVSIAVTVNDALASLRKEIGAI